VRSSIGLKKQGNINLIEVVDKHLIWKE